MTFTSAKYLDPHSTQIEAQRDDGATIVLSAVPGLSAFDELISSGIAIAPPVPQSVTPYQARVALHDVGLLDAVNALMADQAVDASAKIAWDYAISFERRSSFIETLAQRLNLTDSMIDALFVSAAAISQ